MKRFFVLTSIVSALALPGGAEAARFALGVKPGADADSIARTVQARTGHRASKIGPFAVAVDAKTAKGLSRVPGVAYVERLDVRRRVAFVPTDPFFATRQWYVPVVRAFDAWARQPAWLAGIKVGIIDSGIDGVHPEFRGRIAAANTFVGGSALKDGQGHGTFVAGLIAARLDTEGIAGVAFTSQLVVAKVVRQDGAVPLEAEARAIRWAVDKGARVINLSLGGLRDPFDPNHDSYSRLEASAVAYAVRHGAVVVAAVGNSDQAPEQPWKFASYPAALPHVLGVSALARDGSAPTFSNRDAIYNDIAAPGDELFSTLPRPLTALRPTCLEQGYSDCGPPEYKRPQGTSFAAALVTAGAALVRSTWPNLKPGQIVSMLERTAVDQTSATGCRRCTDGRDSLTGWGRLDVMSAVNWAQNRPAPDRFEANDDAGSRAAVIRSRRATIRASIDYWDDQTDVYAIHLRKRQIVRLKLNGKTTNEMDVVIWKPGTKSVDNVRYPSGRVAATAQHPGAIEQLRYRAHRPGLYYVQVKITEPGSGAYKLVLVR